MTVQPTATQAAPQLPAVGQKPDAITTALRSADAQRLPASATSVDPSQAVRQAKETTRQELEDATKRVEKFVGPLSSQLQFSIDEASGTRIVKVLDIATKEVIRQIPSEEMVEIARALESLQGLLLHQKA